MESRMEIESYAVWFSEKRIFWTLVETTIEGSNFDILVTEVKTGDQHSFKLPEAHSGSLPFQFIPQTRYTVQLLNMGNIYALSTT